MKKELQKILQRTLALVLCAAMLLPMAVVPVHAAEGDTSTEPVPVRINETEIVEEPTESFETTEATILAEAESDAVEPKNTAAETEPEVTEAAWVLPDCDCGSADPDTGNHGDGCARKAFLVSFADNSTAAEIYAHWSVLPEDCRAFLLNYLSWDSSKKEKLDDLKALIEESTKPTDPTEPEPTEPEPTEPIEPEEPVTDTETAPDGETVVNVSGIPEGSGLAVAAPSEEALALVESFVAVQGDDSARQLFAWDISLTDNENAQVQPDGTVQVELELPGETLHEHATVYVVHVDDAGNASMIPAQVTESGSITFETDSFSTFAGFTVDFEYNGETFSIYGYETILLSQLFDVLRMPLNVANVDSVTFTNYELITVEEQEDGDWLLTSLAPFDTDEILTVTMLDGTVYEINVTDDSYVTISFNNSGNLDGGTLGVVEWNLMGSGSTGQAYASRENTSSYAPGWTEDYDIYIDGTNATDKNFEIVLQRHNNASGRTLYVDLHTIWIKGGANLTFRLGSSITKENTDTIVVRQVRGYKNDTYGNAWWFGEMFWVEDGSLNLSVPYTAVDKGGDGGNFHEGVQMVFDWDSVYNNVPSGNGPKALISLRKDATSFKANQCVFQNLGYTGGGVTAVTGAEAAIVCRSDDLNEFTMTACEFKDTNKSGGNGSGIYLMSNVADSKAGYTLIHNFNLTNCTFTNCQAGGSGGAVSLRGYVHKGSISGCSFSGCTAGSYGGAVELAGNLGNFTVNNSTFTDCTSTQRGGAVAVRSIGIKNSSDIERWTRSNAITFSGCTFTNCDATDNHGGGIGVQAQLHTLTVSDCDFTNCDTGVNGGAISMDGADLPSTFKNSPVTNYPDWTAEIVCDSCTGYGTKMGGHYNWGSELDDTNTVDRKSWISTVNITDGCTFTNCSAASNGGSIEFAMGCYITDSATISGATIDGSTAVGEGSAIFWSHCYVKSMNLTDSNIQNCNFTGTSTLAGGTVKVTGNTTIVLNVDGCNFINNYSHHHGGGLYWNAARGLDGLECKATVNNCTFDGNTAKEYGGGLYVESKMTITGCNIKNNTAYMGGGIAQQVYNNPGARMLQEGEVSELKLDPTTYVHHNSANLGGGISVRANETGSIEDGKPISYTVRFELNGAAVYQNKANKTEAGEDGHGGGIYFIAESYDDTAKQAEVDKYTKVILINAGTGTAAVYDNTAAGNGGGVYMESSENTELRVQGGHISSNEAVSGGGIYMTGKNATCYVEGGTIGGEGNDSAGNPLANTASKDGGGIAISGGSNIQMTGGTISYNAASHDGGGIWLDAIGDTNGSVANSIIIEDGHIIYNTAGNNGGGISVGAGSTVGVSGGSIDNNQTKYYGGGIHATGSNTLVSISKGSITNNKANTAPYAWGGGIFADASAKVEVSGGVIQQNYAMSSGGGIYALNGKIVVQGDASINSNETGGWGGGIYARGSGAEVTVAGGSIYENTASGCGGGINAEGTAVLDILGGSIYKNTAGTYGGGIHSYNTATITMKGGSIYENEAKQAGGGISLREGSAATVTNDTTAGTVGKITKNTAARGGGVAVESGAALTVENGFITYNKAVGICNQTTAIGHNGSLAGTGGGVYLANDDTADANPAKFTLTGEHIAIYGNLADFAADDVFASGENTLLDVPQKAEMDLAGYDFKPEGWFEDYPTNDTQYEDGLSQATEESGITNGNVSRYRESDYATRVLINDNFVDSDGDEATKNVNDANVYVCMTLGIPAAIPDTVVIDFSLPVDINVLGNEHMYVTDKTTLMSLGTARTEVDGSDWETTDIWSGNQSLDLKYGKAEIKDGLVRYTPDTMEMKDADTFAYAVQYTTSKDSDGKDEYYYYYANVTVIPATTIYYEDSFVSFSVWDTTTSPEVAITDDDEQWAPPEDAEEIEAVQAQDRPGSGLSGIDADNIYGYDAAYNNCTKYSLGSAMKVNVWSKYGTDGNLTQAKSARAEFDFWGTGFDVVSLTSDKTGTILVRVYDKEAWEKDSYGATPVKSTLVDTYYGYKYTLCDVSYTYCTYESGEADDQWVRTVIGEAGAGEMLNEVNTSDKPANGTVRTGVEYAWIVDPAAENALYQVPVMKIEDLNYGNYHVVISASYSSLFDHKQYGETKSYDFYLDAIRIYDPANDGVNTDGTVNGTIQGAYGKDNEGWPEYFELRNLLITKEKFNSLENDTSVSGIVFIDNTLDKNGTNVNSVEDYTNFGPNNELYLAPGQAVAFDLNVTHNTMDKIHLALKSVGGTAKVSVYGIGSDGTKANAKIPEISTATDLYYDITALNGKTVVIQNTGEPSDAILSVTNVKVTYTAAHDPIKDDAYFNITAETAETAVTSLMWWPWPDIDVPEQTEPEETVPETTAPQETEPETTEPDETVPETSVPEETEPAPDAFEPKRFSVHVSDKSVKVGSQVVVTVTASSDVRKITINGQTVNGAGGNRLSGNRTWRVRISADEVGKLPIEVIAYNEKGVASEPMTRSVEVTENYTNVMNWVEYLMMNIIRMLMSQWN